MDTTDDLSGFPAAPKEHALPDHRRLREELLTTIRATGPGRRSAGLPRWVIPAAAAAAVVGIIAAMAIVRPDLARTTLARLGGLRASTTPGQAVLSGGEWRRTDRFSVAGPVHGLTVSTGTGMVTVTGTNRTTVSVTERISYRGAPPRMGNTTSGAQVALGYKCGRGGCGVAYDIQVPRGIAVTVDTRTGGIRLTGLAGRLVAKAVVGWVSCTDLSAAVAELSAKTGGIDATFATEPDLVRASTGIGSVTIRVPGPGPYAVTASTSLGTTSVRVPQAASAAHIINARAQVGTIVVTGS